MGGEATQGGSALKKWEWGAMGHPEEISRWGGSCEDRVIVNGWSALPASGLWAEMGKLLRLQRESNKRKWKQRKKNRKKKERKQIKASHEASEERLGLTLSTSQLTLSPQATVSPGNAYLHQKPSQSSALCVWIPFCLANFWDIYQAS